MQRTSVDSPCSTDTRKWLHRKLHQTFSSKRAARFANAPPIWTCPITPDIARCSVNRISPAAKPLGGWRRCTISPPAAGERAGPAAAGYLGRPIGGSSAPQSAEMLRGRYDALEGQLSGLRNLPTQLEVAPTRSKRVRPSAARRRPDPLITSSRCRSESGRTYQCWSP